METAKDIFIKFLESLQGKSMLEIYEATNKEYLKHKKVQDRYTKYIGEFLFWIQTGVKPAGISFDEFLLYRPLCENLVGNGHLKKEILQTFTQE